MERSVKEAASELQARIDANNEKRFSLMGLKGAGRALMLREAILRLDRPILVVTALPAEAEALALELAFFLGEPPDADAVSRRVHLLPAWELKPFAHLSPSHDNAAAQMAALFALLRLKSAVVVTSVEALMTRTIPRALFSDSVLKIAPGERVDLDALLEALIALGYRRVPQVDEPGDFSVRGGIIDAFAPLYRDPLRIELEDDLVSSIRRFDTANQRSAAEVAEATLIRTRFVPPPVLKDHRVRERVALRSAEIGLVRKEVAELADALESGILFPGAELLMPYLFEHPLDAAHAYLPANTIGWLIDPGRLSAEAQRMAGRISEEAAAAQSKPAFHPAPQTLYLSADELEQLLARMTAVEVGSLITAAVPRAGYALPIAVKCQPSLKLASSGVLAERRQPVSFEPLAVELKEIRRGQGRAVMVVEGPSQAARLRRHLEAYDLEVNTECRTFPALLEWPDYRPAILGGEISAGAALQSDGLYLYSEEDLFGEPRVRRRARRPKGALLNLKELKPSDFVVHMDHGIGMYRGLKHMKVAEVEGDFLDLEYAGEARMYVPVERINLVQRYIGGDGAAPALDRLGSGSWEKVKRRTKQAVLAMAAELLEIYAAREVLEGRAFPHPGAEYHDFAERFEFEETPDQFAAIDEILRDMTRSKPMDRLICGDAGFGKTEVALRAAFVAVMDARQVAILVPTTILAEQHFNTIRARFEGYPVRIEMVSRFRSPRDNKAALADLARGTVDIVVGTHRLLQSDVEFKRLGLLIIDEEHRFGVADKERTKRLHKLVDTLTLTATPIPRTLHMAISGMRDLSVIQTPPPDREAIRTLVGRCFDDDVIRDATLRELNRGGQVFFVHNQVENIDHAAAYLRALLPEAKIAVAHGQMRAHQLEKVMRGFIERRINLLVCSTIIESGMDIPNANTMFVNHAENLGLAQLYQLRGRVGRSRQKAYVYLLIPGEQIITRDAKQRIEALRELVEAEAGAGFQLAMRDLEIRGAGNLLGKEQSGQISEVGFELYTSMMEQAIHELRGEPQRLDFEPELRLGIPAYIPDSFVPDENERLILYRRFARASSDDEIDELRREMRDRFGPLPTLVENLAAAMCIRRRMKEMMILSALVKGNQLEVKFHPDAPVDTARLAALADANRKRLRLTPAFQVMARIESTDYPQTFAQIDAVLQGLAGCEKLEIQPSRPAGPLAN